MDPQKSHHGNSKATSHGYMPPVISQLSSTLILFHLQNISYGKQITECIYIYLFVYTHLSRFISVIWTIEENLGDSLCWEIFSGCPSTWILWGLNSDGNIMEEVGWKLPFLSLTLSWAIKGQNIPDDITEPRAAFARSGVVYSRRRERVCTTTEKHHLSPEGVAV